MRNPALLYQVVIIVQLNYDRMKFFFYLIFIQMAISEDDNLVADRAFSGRRAVKAKRLGTPLTGDYIRLETLSVVHVADHYLLIGKKPDYIHKIAVYSYTAFISKIRFSYGSEMDL